MAFGLTTACSRPVDEPMRYLRAAAAVQDVVVHPRPRVLVHPTPHEIAAYVAAVHDAQVKEWFAAWIGALPPTGSTTIGEGVPCDGELTPCWRTRIESGGTWNAYNPTGCGGNGCFGPYQFSGAWAGKLGLPLDLRTTTHQQWISADRELWAGGAGCSNWDAC